MSASDINTKDTPDALSSTCDSNQIEFQDYMDESQLDHVMQLVTKDLSEPYSSTFHPFHHIQWECNVVRQSWRSQISAFLKNKLSAVFTYRYFLHRFPELCILAVDAGKPIGCVVGKIDREEIIQNGQARSVQTGYIGMLAVQSSYRRTGIGKALVRKVLERMKSMGCQSVTLETGKYWLAKICSFLMHATGTQSYLFS
jgi:peptide alpha-N-acetyltransferase